MEQERNNLDKEQTRITQFEQSIDQQLDDKRIDLYKPVMEKVNKAVSEVAKENGYTFIINVNSGSLLYADTNFDLENLVRKKLDMPPVVPSTRN